MARKRRFSLERASWHDARFQNGTPVEIKSTMHQHSDGQPGKRSELAESHVDPNRRIVGIQVEIDR